MSSLTWNMSVSASSSFSSSFYSNPPSCSSRRSISCIASSNPASFSATIFPRFSIYSSKDLDFSLLWSRAEVSCSFSSFSFSSLTRFASLTPLSSFCNSCTFSSSFSLSVLTYSYKALESQHVLRLSSPSRLTRDSFSLGEAVSALASLSIMIFLIVEFCRPSRYVEKIDFWRPDTIEDDMLTRLTQMEQSIDKLAGAYSPSSG